MTEGRMVTDSGIHSHHGCPSHHDDRTITVANSQQHQLIHLDHHAADEGVRFNFFQKITVTEAGTLTYRWERDDNAVQTKPSELTFRPREPKC